MCHVLVIEDEPRIAVQMRDLVIEAGGSSVDIATTEQDAIVAAIAHRPDIILSDGELREGRGPAACERIRKACGDIPVIFVTATPAVCTSYRRAAAILRKPVPAARVIHALQQAMMG